MKLDSHVHFWKFKPGNYSWINDSMKMIQKDFFPEDLEPLLVANKVEGCIAVQAVQNERETECLLDLSNQYNFIKGVVGWVDLQSPQAGNKLENFAMNPNFKGIRHTFYDEEGQFMQEPSFQKGIALLQKFDLSYDILVFHYQLKGANSLVQNFPDQPFVLDHFGKPEVSEGINRKYEQDLRELGKFPNVYCKISGLFTEAENFQWKPEDLYPFFDLALEIFGVERLIYGSNWPVSLCAVKYSENINILENYLSSKGIPPGGIFSENANRFYRI